MSFFKRKYSCLQEPLTSSSSSSNRDNVAFVDTLLGDTGECFDFMDWLDENKSCWTEKKVAFGNFLLTYLFRTLSLHEQILKTTHSEIGKDRRGPPLKTVYLSLKVLSRENVPRWPKKNAVFASWPTKCLALFWTGAQESPHRGPVKLRHRNKKEHTPSFLP